MGKWILLLYLILLSVSDWRERKVSLVIVCGGVAVSFAVNVFQLIRHTGNGGWQILSMVSGMIPGICMLAVAYLTQKAGYGDGLTLLTVGMSTGYKTCIMLWIVSLFFLSMTAVGMLCLRKADRNTKLPYLPFLTAVYAAGMVT